jgi:hypothetical protein
MASTAIRQDDLLMQAASRGELEKVRAMLDHGAVVKGNNKLLTALHWAVTMGHRDVAELLIERGAAVEARAADGHTPLHMAAREGDAQMVQCLLEARANPNSTNNAGQTAVDLALAFAEDEPEVAQVLLAAGALRSRQLLTAKPMPTRTPLLQVSEHSSTSDGGSSLSGGGGTLAGGGGSLLHGTYDEAAEQAAFQAAVSQWHAGATLTLTLTPTLTLALTLPETLTLTLTLILHPDPNPSLILP